ncbi:hypothetical protein RchiOBHm_Chr2g0130541 [Rosa chinensis]|uniref:Uncharacterized protein n=1 Tax=Rosa chinensis TaxID=74649 RepID=A0A2P6RUT6_ROSCH|nr:hypothetical protein RchiOBHm_Chr2g0130541 [Rosa chinensis]
MHWKQLNNRLEFGNITPLAIAAAALVTRTLESPACYVGHAVHRRLLRLLHSCCRGFWFSWRMPWGETVLLPAPDIMTQGWLIYLYSKF